MPQFIYTLPTWWQAILFIGIGIVLAVGGMYIMRSILARRSGGGLNEVAIGLSQILVPIYAILLAFFVNNVLNDYQSSEVTVTNEASTATGIYRDAGAFKPPVRSSLQRLMRAYVTDVIRYDWPAMRTGHESAQVTATINKLYRLDNSVTDKNHAAGFDLRQRLDVLDDQRDLRIHYSQAALNGVSWALLIVGGIVSLALAWFVYMSNATIQAILTGIYGGMIGGLLLVIVILEHPFTGDVSIPPASFEAALKLFQFGTG